MIIVLRPGATEKQIKHIVEKVKNLGLKPMISKGIERTIIGVFFMSIFEETGWTKVIDFDYLLDSHMKNTAMEK